MNVATNLTFIFLTGLCANVLATTQSEEDDAIRECGKDFGTSTDPEQVRNNYTELYLSQNQLTQCYGCGVYCNLRVIGLADKNSGKLIPKKFIEFINKYKSPCVTPEEGASCAKQANEHGKTQCDLGILFVQCFLEICKSKRP